MSSIKEFEDVTREAGEKVGLENGKPWRNTIHRPFINYWRQPATGAAQCYYKPTYILLPPSVIQSLPYNIHGGADSGLRPCCCHHRIQLSATPDAALSVTYVHAGTRPVTETTTHNRRHHDHDCGRRVEYHRPCWYAFRRPRPCSHPDPPNELIQRVQILPSFQFIVT